MKNTSPMDPKGLIYEAFRIDGITASQCRSIFLDWALSLPEGQDNRSAIKAMLQEFGQGAPDHPMTDVMTQGLDQMTAPRRRGGWRSRPRN